MSIKAGYQRSFVIFTNEDAGYDSGQKAVGHLRLEVNDRHGKLHVSVQNLRNGNGMYKYFVYLLSNRSDVITRACAGELVPELNKAELNWTFDSGNVDDTGLPINEFDIAAILVEHKDGGNGRVICPLAAYITKRAEWRARYTASKNSGLAPNVDSLHGYKGKHYEVKTKKAAPQEMKPHEIKPQEIKPQETKPQEIKQQDIVKPQETKPQGIKQQDIVKPQGIEPQGIKQQDIAKPQEIEPQGIKQQDIVKPQEIEPQEIKPLEVKPQDAIESQEVKQYEIPAAIKPKELKYKELKPLVGSSGQAAKGEELLQESAQENDQKIQSGSVSPYSKFNFDINIEDMLNKAEAADEEADEAADEEAGKAAGEAADEAADEAAGETADEEAGKAAGEEAANEYADPGIKLDAEANNDESINGNVNLSDDIQMQYKQEIDKVNTGCMYLNGNMCAAFVNKEGYPINPCADCRLQHGNLKPPPKPTGNIAWLKEELSRAFEPSDPFHSRRSDYSWWRVTNPVNLNNMLYQSGIRSPLMFNPAVMMAHYKYRHLVIGIFSYKSKGKQYVVCGVPGMYMVDRKPFGEMSRWVQVEGNRPKYGAFGYWLAYIDPDDGKMLSLD